MNKSTYPLQAKVWQYPGMAGWHFITIPKKESEQIKKEFGSKKRGWGSLPVQVTLGDTSWKTSIFPDTKANAYLLPLKAEVRKKEAVFAKDTVSFSLRILV